MKWHDVVLAGYDNIQKTLERILEGLTEEDLNWQPKPDSNSIGWLVWHLSRVQDSFVASLMVEEQVWIRDKWHSRFGRAADARDTGGGQTPQDLAKFKSPDTKTLLDYHRAVVSRSKNYISILSEADLDKTIPDPRFQPPPTVGTRLTMMLSDGLQHTGQAGYVRGLRQGKGWQKF